MKNIGVGPIIEATMPDASDELLEFGRNMDSIVYLHKFNFILAFAQGEVGWCPGPFPQCISFEPGFSMELEMTFFGIYINLALHIRWAPNDADLIWGLQIQVPDLVTELFKLLFTRIHFTPEMMTSLETKLDWITRVFPIFPIFMVTNFELKPFSMTQFQRGYGPNANFDLTLDMHVFGIHIYKRWLIEKSEAPDIGSPQGVDQAFPDEAAVAASILQINARFKKHARCHNTQDLLYEPEHPSCRGSKPDLTIIKSIGLVLTASS